MNEWKRDIQRCKKRLKTIEHLSPSRRRRHSAECYDGYLFQLPWSYQEIEYKISCSLPLFLMAAPLPPSLSRSLVFAAHSHTLALFSSSLFLERSTPRPNIFTMVLPFLWMKRYTSAVGATAVSLSNSQPCKLHPLSSWTFGKYCLWSRDLSTF